MQELFVTLVIGALIGWVASKIMRTKGGLLKNIVIGILGSSFGAWLAQVLGISAEGDFTQLAISIIGACLLIFFGRKLFK